LNSSNKRAWGLLTTKGEGRNGKIWKKKGGYLTELIGGYEGRRQTCKNQGCRKGFRGVRHKFMFCRKWTEIGRSIASVFGKRVSQEILKK